ncbi:prepilin peptidase [Photobacterium leiognathi]|uniref:prepilin peptidase n=1 Tax=Photobacterium leiognathi TaxID=553611 RepID=UPI00020889D0|nr:A24 family peptidase [Photobacterium leiognathi]PSW52132.1 prepilin peptidase [Photobacterium leiognathi subsp. mandapamensis]GAA05003.1 type IV leader peptidase family protein [Photobacterium leiognathi subsp. mandapamensis svers.1.1.]
MAVLDYYPWLYPLFAVIFGLLVGSFLNVVIYRLPIMMERQWHKECQECFPEINAEQDDSVFNLSVPRSRCPHCNHAISALENIPVISWLALGGKCKECKTPISKRYPAIELLTAAMSLTVSLMLPPSWWSQAVIFFTFALIALTFIDIDKMLLPDQITLPLMWAGIVLSVAGISPVSLTDSVIGAMAGYLSLWSVFWVFKLLTKKDGMGYGDFKLLAALGAWLGWQLLPFVVLLSSLVGALCGLVLLKMQDADNQTPFSFGPYLAIAGWIAMLWGAPIIDWYLTSYLGM